MFVIIGDDGLDIGKGDVERTQRPPYELRRVRLYVG